MSNEFVSFDRKNFEITRNDIDNYGDINFTVYNIKPISDFYNGIKLENYPSNGIQELDNDIEDYISNTNVDIETYYQKKKKKKKREILKFQKFNVIIIYK